MAAALTLIMCCLALAQPTRGRKAAAMAYSSAAAFHMAFFNSTPSYIMYYVSAGVCASAVLMYLCERGRASQFTDNLIYLCVASILLNLYGLVICQMGMGPDSYNMAGLGVYAMAIILLVKGDKGDGVIFYNWLRDLCRASSERGHLHSEVCAEAKSCRAS